VHAAPCRGTSKGTQIRLRFNLPAHAWIWSAGIVACLLATSGVVAIVRVVPFAYANGSDEMRQIESGQTFDRSADLRAAEEQLPDAPARLSSTTPFRASCTECGTIASVREIPAWRDIGWRERVDAKGAPSDAGITSTIAIDKAPASERIYEVTVRFRDGRTTTFNESGSPTWHVGNRVIVIAGADPSRTDTRSARSAGAVKTAANDR
jgi:hypothetical protein